MLSTEHNPAPTGFGRVSGRTKRSDNDVDIETKGALSELKRINEQIATYTDQINNLTDERNKAYGYERWLKEQLALRQNIEQQ